MHTILIGDAREQLATIPDGTVQTCITSPPYYGLRDYGHDGQIGLEDTVDAYVAALVDVFREVRRVLKDDGTLWLNLGDSYASGGTGGYSEKSTLAGFTNPDTKGRVMNGQPVAYAPPAGLKPKDLIGVPWRVAFALQADGWWLRQANVWHKPNPMPESVTDRTTTAHEYVFHLTKSSTYYYDAAAIAEPHTDSNGSRHAALQRHGTSNGPEVRDKNHPSRIKTERAGLPGVGTTAGGWNPAGRNKRSVWTVSTKPYSGAHFAVFPPKLIEPCILAGTSERGQCRACGAPWVRVVERGQSEPDPTQRSTAHYNTADRYGAGNGGNSGFDKLAARMRAGENGTVTKGWSPSCECDAGAPIPQTVLDPFAGSGTTGAVAELHGRRTILIELNPDYRPLIDQRLAQRTIWQALTEVS